MDAHTLDYGINICIPAFYHLCNHLFPPSCSRSTTWAPAVMAAMAAMVPTSRWSASVRQVRATGTRGRQQKRRARPSPPVRFRRFVKGSTCWRTKIPRFPCVPLLLQPHRHRPSLSRRRTLTVSCIYFHQALFCAAWILISEETFIVIMGDL